MPSDWLEARDPHVNAVVTRMYDQARAQINKDLPAGLLAGVPFLLKDLTIQYKGAVTTAATKLCRDAVATHHSTLTQRYLDAGVVILGKSNTPEFGLSGTTESEVLGPCRNPWDTTRSGGAAAAVAARMTPAAHASDAGGSIRNPSSNCGVFGLKTTRARTPLGPVISEGSGGLSIQHVITRTVRDSAAFLDVSAGAAPGDAYTAPPEGSFMKQLEKAPRQLRIAFHTQPHHDVAIHPECVRAVELCAQLCEELGHIVVEDRPAINGEQEMEVNRVLWSANLATTAGALFAAKQATPDRHHLEENTWNIIRVGQQLGAEDYIRAVQAMHQTGRDIAQFFEKYDVVLSPVLSQPA